MYVYTFEECIWESFIIIIIIDRRRIFLVPLKKSVNWRLHV